MKSFAKMLSMLLVFAGLAATVLAQPTASGTNITNTASATFVDSNGANRSTQSNTVTTIVQTVYYFNVEPDTDGTSGINPGPTAGTVDPTALTNNDFASAAFASNDLDVSAGNDAVLTYSVENLSNKAVELSLSVAQASTDDYDLTDIKIYIDLNDDGTRDANELYFDGSSSSFPNIASFPNNRLSLPISDGTAGSGPDFYDVYVVGTVPGGQDGNDLALIDLQVENFTGVNDGSYTPTANANELYENNNLGRVEVNEVVLIGLAKSLTTTTNNGDGTWDLTFTFNLKNYSNVALSNVNVTDDLATIFASAASYNVTALSATGNLTANSVANVNGGSSSLLVPASSSLAKAGDANDTASVSMTVKVTPSTTAGAATMFSFNNTATASGQSPDGTTDTDTSFNGTATDDGDDDPDDDSSTTPISLTENPVIGVAKQAGTVTDNNNGTFTVPFTLTVENLGNMNLHDVQVTDVLDNEFGTHVTSLASVDTAGEYTVANLTVTDTTTGTAITANTNFNGDDDSGDAKLLTVSGSAALEVGQSITISFDLTFYPDFAKAPFNNQASASGDLPRNANGVANADTSDLSNNGTDPDTDDDGLSNEQATDYDLNNDGTTAANEGNVDDTVGDSKGDDTTVDDNSPTPINVNKNGNIGIAKAAGSPVDNGDGTFTVPFTLTVENMGNVDLYDVDVTDSLSAEFGTYNASTPTSAGSYTLTDADSVTAGVQVVAIDASSTATGFSVDSSFTGSGTNTNLLSISGSNPLKVGKKLVLKFNLRFYPNFANAPFTNQATATGDEPDSSGAGNGAVGGAGITTTSD
ncbi:MAG: hypothetical protein KC422_24020, partial [Trueperaceae bacterium]|nr:hypothetical protein [Trueperaceae bacterium]